MAIPGGGVGDDEERCSLAGRREGAGRLGEAEDWTEGKARRMQSSSKEGKRGKRGTLQ